jgi:predicted acyltransferase (DUF342 family)
MSPAIGVAAFFSLTLGVVFLPFLPALVEWRRRTDASPLHVEHESTVLPRHFALRFRSYVETHLAHELESCRERGSGAEILLPDRIRCLIVSRADSLLLTEGGARARSIAKVVAACSDLQLPSGTHFSHEIYAAGSVYGGDGVVVRAVLAENDLVLGDHAVVLRWAHAGGELRAGVGACLYGRLTSDREIRLDGACTFERLHAPRIEFGPPGEPILRAAPPDREPLRSGDLPHVVDVSGARWLVRRDLEVPAGALVRTDLVATGGATVGRGARIEGSIKSHGDLRLEEGCEVVGSVVSERDVILGRGCRVLGPILAERTVHLHEGSTAGTLERLTTISASRILAHTGAVAHGTVWAREEGALA